MKFVCKGLDLNDALSKVIKACSTKGVGTVLEGVKLVAENGTLTLTATDLELAIEKTITAEIFEEGEALVPGKLFSEFVRRLTNMNVECLLTEKNQLRISYGESTGLISCYNVLEFPNFKKIENAEYFQLKQKDLKDIISKTLVSVALDDSKPVFKGVLFEVEEKSLTAVSLDGFRLSKIEKPITKSTAQTSAIIPSRSLTEIHKLLEDTDAGVKIKIQKNYLMAELKETVILTRL
ncbi:MAG: DNA polymerase III subunit beta, partial [Firmicutes bacterium]|nr:DNA polymerase III subunit beta [Bacillota bacterium]